MIVQRRADQLQPGDILPNPRRVVITIGTAPRGMQPDGVVAWTIRLGPNPPGAPVQPPLPPQYLDPLQPVDVEAPDLTPVQARADELADLLEKAINFAGAQGYEQVWAREAARLIGDLRPKKPTLEEALAALDGIDEAHMPPSSKAVLERARRTGLL